MVSLGELSRSWELQSAARGVALLDEPAGREACGASGPCEAQLTLLSHPHRKGGRKLVRCKSSSCISNLKSPAAREESSPCEDWHTDPVDPRILPC